MKDIQIIPELLNKTVVITGASSGVGLATAEAFSRSGCKLILAARGEDGLSLAVQRCQALGGLAIAVPTDVSDYIQVKKLLSEALAFGGKIDYWVNNAGVMASGRFEEVPIEVSHQVIKTNLFGYLNCAHAVLPIFKQQGHGVIVNNVSIGGFMPAPYSAVYSATKFGIKGMMECLQGELSDEAEIHICNLYPQIQRSTGNMHSAKYSGLEFKVPPLAADPRDTAAQLLDLAVHPKKDKFPDFSSWGLKTLHSLFPKLIVNTASAGMRLMMKLKNGKPTDGNVLQKSGAPYRIYGQTSVPVPSKQMKLMIGLGVCIGAGLMLLSNNRR